MHTILLFLNKISINEIEAIRLKHDPLFGLIPPHITIVFPFESAYFEVIKRDTGDRN